MQSSSSLNLSSDSTIFDGSAGTSLFSSRSLLESSSLSSTLEGASVNWSCTSSLRSSSSFSSSISNIDLVNCKIWLSGLLLSTDESDKDGINLSLLLKSKLFGDELIEKGDAKIDPELVTDWDKLQDTIFEYEPILGAFLDQLRCFESSKLKTAEAVDIVSGALEDASVL